MLTLLPPLLIPVQELTPRPAHVSPMPQSMSWLTAPESDAASPARTMLGSHQRVNVDGVHLKPCEHGLQGSQHVLYLRAAAWRSGTRTEFKQACDLLSKAARAQPAGRHHSTTF